MGGLHREYHRIADHQQIAIRAKAQPGQWQRVGVYTSTEVARATVIHVHSGSLAAYAPAGHFQAYQTLGLEGRGVWVRYIHGVTPTNDLPERLPEAAQVVLAAHMTADRYVSARWAADLLAAKGHSEAADRLRSWLDRDGRRSARQAAAYLLQTSTIREDADR